MDDNSGNIQKTPVYGISKIKGELSISLSWTKYK